jgi:hypothetical protein
VITTLLVTYGAAACVAQAWVGWPVAMAPAPVSTARPAIVLTTLALLVPLAVAAVAVPMLEADVDELVLDTLLAASSDLTDQRYRGDALPWYANPLLACVYLLALVGGWTWWERGPLRRPSRVATGLGLLCATAYAVLTTARATMLFALIFFAAALIGGRILAQAQGRLRSLRIRTMLGATLAAGVFAVSAFLVGGLVRAADEDLAFVLAKGDAYLGGITGLSDWLLRSGVPPPSWGAFTFAGVADAMGVRVREIGITQEYFTMPSGNPSNLYTSVRWLIEDFGLGGAHLAMGLLGLVAGSAWVYLRRGRQSGGRIYVAVAAIVIASPIASLLAYNTLLAAFLAFLVWSGLAYRQHPRLSPGATRP